MDKNIDPRQQAIREVVKDFAEKDIHPVSQELDRASEPREFPKSLYEKLGAAGFIGMSLPKEFGGQGKSHLEYVTLIEELSYHDAAVGLLCAVGELAASSILRFGDDKQKKRYVPDCITGGKVVAFVLTESETGSDAAMLKTVAVDKGDHYLVSGEKIFIQHGDVADIGVVFCKMENQSEPSALIVDDTGQSGWQARTLKNKMGMRASTVGGIILKEVKVPKENVLGEPGRGASFAAEALDNARIVVAALSIGMAQRALDESAAYAKARHAFGQPIAKLQAIQWMIADMATRLAAGRAMVYDVARRQDAGEDYSIKGSMARLFTAETANFCVDRAMQIHAGYGYIGEFSPIEKLYRDQRALELYEGSSEVQQLVIADNVIGR
ncbi:MAG: acyl-CoA dehydrogenase family protein [Candidatus Zixiibacteriota bacterium]|nr:MAG: acyl-CoA dehydrogenase family protein [candidate division Zixibacteria bacterium]